MKAWACFIIFACASTVSAQWPKTDDPWLVELGKKVKPYDHPLAFQHFGGVHSRVIAAFPDGKPSDANHEFPWGFPAGMHSVAKKDYGIQRFVHLTGPITYWRQDADNIITIAGPGGALRREPITVWEYSPGTTFAELLSIRHKGQSYPFELRIRTKVAKGDWAPKVYRPLPTREDLDVALEKSGWAMDMDPSKRLMLESPHKKGTFARKFDFAKFPAMDEGLVKKLLSEPFKRVDSRFDETVHYPTSDAEFGIVPKGYLGGMVRVSKNSCMGCHEHTLMAARGFDVKREWYGRVRGSDNILSFHIFDQSSISNNGSVKPIRFRQDLVQAGLLKAR